MVRRTGYRKSRKSKSMAKCAIATIYAKKGAGAGISFNDPLANGDKEWEKDVKEINALLEVYSKTSNDETALAAIRKIRDYSLVHYDDESRANAWRKANYPIMFAKGGLSQKLVDAMNATLSKI